MATLFPRYASNNGFDTLLRLLDTSGEVPHHTRHSHTRTFTPKFDVREGATGYELHGELPGIKQEDIDIEFVDAATLVIKGRTARDVVKSSDDEEAKAGKHFIEGKPAVSHKATVEDESADTTVATTGKQENGTVETRREEPAAYRYWVSERSVGEFQRTFTFPGRVDRDAVKASLKDGILTVVIPKLIKKEAETRKIAIG